MIGIWNQRPKNKEHFARLLEFCKEVVALCSDLGIEPVLTGSLAVFGYTQSQAIEVNDIDLACSELEFPGLSRALDAKGFAHELKEWHVLQVRKDDLKVEFDSMEYWMAGLQEDYDTLMLDGCTLKVVGLAGMKELYRRGLQATAGQSDEANRAKHSALAEKIETLNMVSDCGPGQPWYHGSPFELSTIREGSTITQKRELARIFSHRPTVVSVSDDGQIKHNGTMPGYLYAVADEIRPGDLVPHPGTTMAPGDEWLTTRELRLRLLGPTEPAPEEQLTDRECASLASRLAEKGKK